MTAAVADFRPDAAQSYKIKKSDAAPAPIVLEKNPDVLAELVAARRPGQVLVGFAAEHGEGALDYARGKLERKGLDAIVVNDISQQGIGFDAPENEVTILTATGSERHLVRAGKGEIADGILDEVEKLLAKESDDRAARADADRAARV